MKNPQNERWVPLPGYESRYQISDHGRLYAIPRTVTYCDGRSYQHPGRLIKTQKNPGGALYVGIGNTRDTIRRIRLASLVLLAFVGPRPDGMEVLHWDDNPDNNTLENLRYGTRSENMHDRVRNGRHSAANKTHCKRGHAFSAENTFITQAGHRSCRVCKRALKRKYAAAARVTAGRAS